MHGYFFFFQPNYAVPGGRLSPSISEADLCNPCDNIRHDVSQLFKPPPNKVLGVNSDSYVHLFVRSSVHPSQSLIRYSSKTAEQNFMKLSGIVHYMMPYCTSYFNIWGFPEQNKDFAIQNMGEQGVSFCERCSQYFQLSYVIHVNNDIV